MRPAVPLAIALAAAVALACAHDADAATVRKLHFTSTYTSYPDPSGDNATVAMVLPPSEGTIYVGSLTYASASPMRPVVLHDLHGPPAGQPTWGVPGQDEYAASLLGAEAASGSFDFAGAAVLLRSGGPDPFVATASVDAFARGQPAEIRVETVEVVEAEPAVRLVRAEVPVTLPLREGILDGERVLYAITESSDADLAESLTEAQGRPVTHSAPLAALLEEAESGGHEPPRVYAFRNGVKGDGLEGYQHEIFEAGPGDRAYSPATELVYAEWRRNLNPEVITSAEDLEQAVTDRRVSLEEPRIVLNLPAVSWPGGAIPLGAPEGGAGGVGAEDAAEGDNGGDGGAGSGEGAGENGDAGEQDAGEGAGENGDAGEQDAGEGAGENGDAGEQDAGEGAGENGDAEASDTVDAPADEDVQEDAAKTDVVVPEAYQATEVNVEEMTATLIARRAWGPDGQTVYHIMAGATPPGPARVTGTAPAQGMQNYTATSAVADLYYFRGGLAGDGALGSQPSVAATVPGDDAYTPLWRVHVVEWADGGDAAIVETRGDIDHLKETGEVTVRAARPLGLELVVNAPVVDPFWEPAEDDG